jgi:SAM-dependent methyltransferase
MNNYADQDEFPVHDFEVDQMNEALAALGVVLPAGSVCLDVGGARGQHAARIADVANRVHVIDQIPYHALDGGSYVETLRQMHAKYDRSFPFDRLIFTEMDAQDLLFKEHVFDFTYSINSFEHIPNPALAFDEMMRVLKPGGIVYIQFDPIWASPFGHHLPHLLHDPWMHLINQQGDVHRLIIEGGGTENDIRIYDTEMNRRGLHEYFAIFNAARLRFKFDCVGFSWWPTRQEDEPLCGHPNFAAAREAGYGPNELFVRGLRFCGRLAAPAS